MSWTPGRMLQAGIAIAVAGWALLFAMLLDLIPAGFLLSGIGYMMSVAGVGIAFGAAVQWTQRARDLSRSEERWECARH